jgi:hypothetical protein
VLHTSRATVVAGEKVSAQLGRIVELSRDNADLGPLKDTDESFRQEHPGANPDLDCDL